MPVSDTDPAATTAPRADEIERIRAVYRDRDRSGPRARSIGEAYRRLNDERHARLRRLFSRLFPDGHPRLLDVGCGTGSDLARWLADGWPSDRLSGVDVIEARLSAATERCPGIDLRLSSEGAIPFATGAFDVATATTVFSSILDPDSRQALFGEMARVVRPGGAIVIYDFVIRKPTNRHVIGMPLHRLAQLGSPPTESWRLSPMLYLVALGATLHPRLADLAMHVAPATHRLSYWRVPGSPVSASTS